MVTRGSRRIKNDSSRVDEKKFSSQKGGINQKQKLSFLHKNKIIERDKTPAKTSINRLYSFYQRNPLDTPIALAYGLRKRINKRVGKYGGTYKLSTPKQPVTAEEYVKKQAERITLQTQKQISQRATLKPHIYRRYVDRLQDFLTYRYHITCNEKSLTKVLTHIQKNIMPEIRKDISIVTRNFIRFYHTPLVGSIATFESGDFPLGEGSNFQRVAYTRIYRNQYREQTNFFMDSLFESIKNGLLICLQYDQMTITFTKLEIVITSDKRATAYEKLRA